METAPRIMIVEDDVLQAWDLAECLTDFGIEVVAVATSGEEAVEKAENVRPDLVLMDIKLKGEMDGIEAASQIQAQVCTAVVYLTAHDESDLFRRATSIEPFAYVTKPASPAEIHRSVEIALYKHAMEEKLKASQKRLEVALEGADLGLWDWNVATGEVIRNHRLAEMVGYTPDQLEPTMTGWESLIHPEDLPQVTQALALHLRGATPSYASEHRLRTQSRLWIWVLERGRVVERDREGKPLRMSGTCLDISGQKESAQEREQLVSELREALARVKKLRGLVPICSSCKRIRDDEGYWHEVEDFFATHSGAEFSHGICPDCVTRLYPHFEVSDEG